MYVRITPNRTQVKERHTGARGWLFVNAVRSTRYCRYVNNMLLECKTVKFTFARSAHALVATTRTRCIGTNMHYCRYTFSTVMVLTNGHNGGWSLATRAG